MRFAFLASFLLISPTVSSAKLKLCSTADWPPYESINPVTKKVEGMSVDIVRKLMTELGLEEPAIASFPWERCLEMTKSGAMDGLFSVSKNDEREKFLVYPNEHMMNVTYSFASLKGTECKWCADKKDLMLVPQPLGAPQGYSIINKLREQESRLIIDDSATSDAVNLDKLVAGRLKSIIVSTDVLKALIAEKKLGDKIEVINPPFVDNKAYYVAISKKYMGLETEAQKLADRISVAISKIKAKK